MTTAYDRAAHVTPAQVGIEEKVRWLRCPTTYPEPAATVEVRETHMSWVFMVDGRVYKLKKPVRFPYLDFSTLERREAACRAEYRLNRRLAPDVYLGVLPLMASPSGLSLGGFGQVVDFIVLMRRLPEEDSLEAALKARRVARIDADRIAATLSAFYRHAPRLPAEPARHLVTWQRTIDYDRRVLSNPRFGLPPGLIEVIARVQRRFLSQRSDALLRRLREHRIIDAHGDLRPEHIWLGPNVTMIDRLEFDPKLRALDPLNEIAYLDLECARLGAEWVGKRIRRRMASTLGEDPEGCLFLFYRIHWAMLRARLAITHLLDPKPRVPEKWPRLARAYLARAKADAVRLERLLRRP